MQSRTAAALQKFIFIEFTNDVSKFYQNISPAPGNAIICNIDTEKFFDTIIPVRGIGLCEIWFQTDESDNAGMQMTENKYYFPELRGKLI